MVAKTVIKASLHAGLEESFLFEIESHENLQIDSPVRCEWKHKPFRDVCFLLKRVLVFQVQFRNLCLINRYTIFFVYIYIFVLIYILYVHILYYIYDNLFVESLLDEHQTNLKFFRHGPASQFKWLERRGSRGLHEIGSTEGSVHRFQVGDGTVDGRNPAPVDMVNIRLFFGFYTSQVVQDFSHQQ